MLEWVVSQGQARPRTLYKTGELPGEQDEAPGSWFHPDPAPAVLKVNQGMGDLLFSLCFSLSLYFSHQQQQ